MRYHKAHLLKKFVGCIAAAILLLVAMTGAALAQGGPPAGTGPPANNNPNLESRTREKRESTLRSAELDAAMEKRNQQRLEAVIVQVKEDFSRLQIIRNEIARNLVARKPLDYHLISDQTAEINKRANRLKIYMMPRAPEDKEKEPKNPPDQHPPLAARVGTPGVGTPQTNSENMTGALVRLCKLIDSFVENPALKNEVNAQQLDKAKADKARADSDLLSIVELSNDLQKSAESLKKAPK